MKRLFFSRAKETLRTPDTISQITLIDNEKDEEAQHFAGFAMAEAWNMEERPSFRRRGPSSNDALPPQCVTAFYANRAVGLYRSAERIATKKSAVVAPEQLQKRNSLCWVPCESFCRHRDWLLINPDYTHPPKVKGIFFKFT